MEAGPRPPPPSRQPPRKSASPAKTTRGKPCQLPRSGTGGPVLSQFRSRARAGSSRSQSHGPGALPHMPAPGYLLTIEAPVPPSGPQASQPFAKACSVWVLPRGARARAPFGKSAARGEDSLRPAFSRPLLHPPSVPSVWAVGGVLSHGLLSGARASQGSRSGVRTTRLSAAALRTPVRSSWLGAGSTLALPLAAPQPVRPNRLASSASCMSATMRAR